MPILQQFNITTNEPTCCHNRDQQKGEEYFKRKQKEKQRTNIHYHINHFEKEDDYIMDLFEHDDHLHIRQETSLMSCIYTVQGILQNSITIFTKTHQDSKHSNKSTTAHTIFFKDYALQNWSASYT